MEYKKLNLKRLPLLDILFLKGGKLLCLFSNSLLAHFGLTVSSCSSSSCLDWRLRPLFDPVFSRYFVRDFLARIDPAGAGEKGFKEWAKMGNSGLTLNTWVTKCYS